MDKLEYKIDGFEGPLDLLLYLISKNKLDITGYQADRAGRPVH